MPAKDCEPHIDNPATENLGKTTPADKGDKKKTLPRKRQSSTASPTGPTDLPAKGDTNAASGAGELRLVPIKQLTLDKDMQLRVKIDKSVVENYSEEMKRREFPPLRTVFDGKTYWVWDGAHRLLVAQARGAKKIQVLVTLGTRNDALWLAVSANQDHGLQRTNADKQCAVKAALRHPKAKDLVGQPS